MTIDQQAKHDERLQYDLNEWLKYKQTMRPATDAEIVGFIDGHKIASVKLSKEIAQLCAKPDCGACPDDESVCATTYHVADELPQENPDNAGQVPVASVVSRSGNDLRVGWLKPEHCNVGSFLYAAPLNIVQQAPDYEKMYNVSLEIIKSNDAAIFSIRSQLSQAQEENADIKLVRDHMQEEVAQYKNENRGYREENAQLKERNIELENGFRGRGLELDSLRAEINRSNSHESK